MGHDARGAGHDQRLRQGAGAAKLLLEGPQPSLQGRGPVAGVAEQLLGRAASWTGVSSPSGFRRFELVMPVARRATGFMPNRHPSWRSALQGL